MRTDTKNLLIAIGAVVVTILLLTLIYIVVKAKDPVSNFSTKELKTLNTLSSESIPDTAEDEAVNNLKKKLTGIILLMVLTIIGVIGAIVVLSLNIDFAEIWKTGKITDVK